MKKIVKLFAITAALLLVLLPISVKAENRRLIDECGILSTEEKTYLTNLFDEISVRQQCDIVCVIVPSLNGKDIQDYADDFYDYNNYGFGPERDGIILVVRYGEHDGDLKMSTTGAGITYFTDYGLDDVLMPILENNMRANPAYALELWAKKADYMITEAKNGKPVDVYYTKVELYVKDADGNPVNGTFDIYDSYGLYWDYIVLNNGYGSVYVEENMNYTLVCYDIQKGYDEPNNIRFNASDGRINVTVQKSKYNFAGNSVFAGIAGLITSLIGTGVLKGKNKSVYSRSEAGEYRVNGSFRLHDAREYYLYSQTSRTPKSTGDSGGSSGNYHGSHHSSSGGSSTHHSSSGSSNGGSRTGHF